MSLSVSPSVPSPDAGPELLPVLYVLMVAETNIDLAFALMPSQQRNELLELHVEDYDFATTILSQSGFKLIKQEDLSR